MNAIRTVDVRDNQLLIIDQTVLPSTFREITVDSVDSLWEAIRALRVRGAPAIGIAASFGAWIACRHAPGSTGHDLWQSVLTAHAQLRTARPTAVNLFWALDRVEHDLMDCRDLDAESFRHRAFELALEIRAEDEQMCSKIGEAGLPLLRNGMTVLTHCNAGSLATARYGTALAPIYAATERGMDIHVIADETRPLLQGSRLTAWELGQAGIPTTVICDSAAGMVMRSGKVDLILVGADRIAANGDVANKIGTYSLAVLARAHGIPMYVAAPASTIDFATPSGEEIVIEERDAAEILTPFGLPIGPVGANAYNPAFDVTPAGLLTGLITERGLIQPLTRETLAQRMYDPVLS